MLPRSAVKTSTTSLLNKAMVRLTNAAPGLLTLTGAGIVLGNLFYESQREHDITSLPFGDNCNDIVKNSAQFEIIDKPHHGTLTAHIVRNKETDKVYIKKAAHSRPDLVKEYMCANFLHAVNDEQPESLIMQSTDKHGKTHFHTLSRKFDDTQDVEDFVRAGRTDEMKEKQVIGLEAALAADQMLGKQSDTKLANMTVKWSDTRLIFATIDHERAQSPNRKLLESDRLCYTTDPAILVNAIHDLTERSEDNHAGLAGDPRATEFGNLAKEHINPEKVSAFYHAVAKTNIEPVISNCYLLAKSSTLFHHQECTDYKNHFKRIQAEAREYAHQFDMKA